MHMALLPCFQCGFRTKETHEIVPGGRALPLCKLCRKKTEDPPLIFGEGVEDSPGRTNYVLTDELAEKARAMRGEGKSYKEISIELGISVGTVFKACRGLECLDKIH